MVVWSNVVFDRAFRRRAWALPPPGVELSQFGTGDKYEGVRVSCLFDS